jgi:hypothetical protein
MNKRGLIATSVAVTLVVVGIIVAVLLFWYNIVPAKKNEMQNLKSVVYSMGLPGSIHIKDCTYEPALSDATSRCNYTYHGGYAGLAIALEGSGYKPVDDDSDTCKNDIGVNGVLWSRGLGYPTVELTSAGSCSTTEMVMSL